MDFDIRRDGRQFLRERDWALPHSGNGTKYRSTGCAESTAEIIAWSNLSNPSLGYAKHCMSSFGLMDNRKLFGFFIFGEMADNFSGREIGHCRIAAMVRSTEAQDVLSQRLK